MGMRAALAHEGSGEDMVGVRVALQGVGNVGYNLCRILHEHGAELIVSDVFADNAKRAVTEFRAKSVDPEEIYDADADIFAPCGRGSILNDQTIPQLKPRIVAGAANNQLAEDRHGVALAERGIVYLPDYVVNGGGLVFVAAEYYREDEAQIVQGVDKIYDTCLDILSRAHQQNIPTSVAADRIAEERFMKPKAQQ